MVYNFGVKSYIRHHPLFLLTILASLIFSLNLYFHSAYLDISSDTAAYADMARSLIAGKGLMSHFIQPNLLPFTKLLPAGVWPAYYLPLYPALIALSFVLFGIKDSSVVLVSGFFYVAIVPLLFCLVKKLFSQPHALLTTIWYIFFAPLLTYATGGMSEPLFTFLSIASITVYLVPTSMFWTGIVAGLTLLVRFQGWLVIAAFLTHISFFGQKKVKNLGRFALGAALIVVTKKLFFPPTAFEQPPFVSSPLWNTIATNAVIPVAQLEQSLTSINLPALISFPGPLIKKFVMNLYFFWQQFFRDGAAIIGFLGLLFYAKNRASASVVRLWWLTGFLFGYFLLFHLATIMDLRYFYPLSPLLLIFAADIVIKLIKSQTRHKLVLFLFISLFIVLPFFTAPGTATSIERSIKYRYRPTLNQMLGEFVKKETTPDATLVTTNHPYVAWYGERRVLTIPYTLTELERIDSEYVKIDGLVFLTYPALPDFPPEWQDLIDTPRDFGNWKFVKKHTIKPEDNYYNTPAEITLYLKKQN